MFSNLKTKKRITQLLIAVVAIAITVTGSAFLLNDFVQEAKAADVTVNNISEWNSFVGGATSGSTVNVTLGADLKSTDTGSLGLKPVPSGVTVNLYMNGKTIQWYNVATGNKDIISTSYPFANTYWGMITNNGTLNITGTGTISQYQVRYNNKNSDNQNNYGHKSAAIVNNGTLTVGASITVENFACQSNTDGDKYQDMFIYSHAIYNTGTVSSSGTIQSGAFAQGVTNYSTNAFAHAFSYGIFGGNVNISGGNIYSEAKSGYTEKQGLTTGTKGNKVGNYAVGVFSNNATVYGNTTITTKSLSWRDDTGDYNLWKDGWNMSWSVGVLHSGTNYPYIGGDVSINAAFTHHTSGAVTFPELNGKTSLMSYTRESAGDPGSYSRRAYAVAGIPASDTTAMAGLQSTEVNPDTALGVSTNNGNAGSTLYRSDLARYQGLTETVSVAGASQSGANSAETKNSIITMGAPGNNAGGQYMVYYRYRDLSNKIIAASTTPNTAINSKMVFTPTSGVFTADQTALTRSGSSGAVTNDKFYELIGTYYVAKTDGNFGTGVDCSKLTSAGVTNQGQQFTNSQALTAGNSYYIWADYKALPATNVKIVAASAGTELSYLSKGTSFETTYSGKTLVPGTDFNIAVIDMKNDIDAEYDDTSDNTVVTDSYAVSGTDSSKVQLEYSYSTDGTNYTAGLPKNVGTYTIKVLVPSDTDINRAGAGNRNGGTYYLTATIKQATPTIGGETNKSGTYGSTMAELIPTSDFTITGKNNESMTGTWSYDGFAASDYPTVDAAAKGIVLRWTPSGECATNYKAVSTTVNLKLAKRDVTVVPSDSTVTYGASKPDYVLNYTNLAACDDNSKAQWLANSTFEVNYNGTWQAYSSTMIPGKYEMRIASFGGDTANNNFTYSGTSTLTINKAPLYYTATATNKIYDGKAEVNVNLNYTAGAVNGDSYSATLTTKGTLENANAGENKAVTVVTDGLDFISSDKYYIAIQNSPVVTISKATPTATAETYSFTYDSERTLSKIALTGQASVAGTWSWKDASIVPTVDVTKYTAVFTPTDTTNYNVIEVPVTINIAKKEVVISVENKNIAYGDGAPALNLVYTGFTGADTIDTVTTTGTVAASTDYSMGKDVGTYPITIKMTDYEAVNYSFKVATDCVINVAKKNITITAPSGEITYGDNDLQFGVNDLIIDPDALVGTDTLTEVHDEAMFEIVTAYEKDNDAKNDAGDHAVTVINTADAANYSFTFVEGTLKVKKAVLTVTADNKTISYNQNTPNKFDWTFSGFKFDTDAEPSGEPALSTQYRKGDHAGQYAISIELGNLSHKNYSFNLVGGVLTVEKLTLNTTNVSVSATIIHGEAYSSAVFTDNSITDAEGILAYGTFALKDASAIADYTTAIDDFGTKYIIVKGIFTPTDSDNYNAVELDVYLYITPHAITGAPVITGTAMVDNTITASVAGMAPSDASCYTYAWYVGNSKAGTASTYVVKESDVGKTIYVVVSAIEDKGYIGSAQSANVTAVEKFSKIVSADQLDIAGIGDTYTYDGATHGATVTVKAAYAGLVSENITVYYNGSTNKPYSAGTYIVTVDVGTPNVPAGASQTERDKYYGPVSGLEIGTITIGKRAYTATFEVADKVYDGTRRVEYYNVTPGDIITEDAVYLDGSMISIVFNKANVGEHAIDITGLKLTGDDASNYELVIESTTAKITKRTLTATANGVPRFYNGSTQVNVEFTNITGYASIDSASTVFVATATATATSANAGTWDIVDIKYELGGSSAANYNLEISYANKPQVTIKKADIVVEPPVVSGDDLIYNANRTLANIDLEDYYNKDSTGYWQFDDTSIVPTVKKTQYAATFVVPENSNYNSYKTNITVNIKPKTVVLKAKDVTVAYGKAASYAIEEPVFTGNDSLATMGGTQPTYVCTYTMGENIGTYTIKINHNLDSNGNYIFETVNGTLTVVPAELYVSATATDRDYNDSTGVEVKFAITSGKYSNDDVALSVTSANGVASSANAGTRTVSYTAPTLTGSKANNYKIVLSPASGILTVNINKLDPTGYVFPTSATIPFGYALSWAQFSDDAKGDGTFAFASKNEVPATMGSNYSFEVVFTPTDATNYNTVSKYIPLTVTECVVNYVVGVTGTPQVGQKLSVTFTGLPSKAYEYVQYQWYRDTDNGPVAISGANTSTYTATENDVGYEIFCFTYFNAGDPYVFEDGITDIIGELEGIFGSTSGSIEEENLTFWQRLVRWIESIIQALTGIMWSF